MWLSVVVPAFSTADPSVRVARVHAAAGERLARGQRLLDLTVDLSGGVARDCPPISTCRIVLREDAWLRTWCVGPGDVVAPGAVLALLSSAPDSPEEAPARVARVTAATVVHHTDWWTAQP